MTIARFRLVLGCLLGALAVTSACGGDDSADTDGDVTPADPAPDADGGDLPDPCTLLTASEIDAATGLDFGPGDDGDPALRPPGGATCVWTNADPYAVVVVTVGPGSVYESAQTAGFESGAPDEFVDLDIDGADDARISGLGDILAMRVGDLYVQVANGLVLDESDQYAPMTAALARAAAANL